MSHEMSLQAANVTAEPFIAGSGLESRNNQVIGAPPSYIRPINMNQSYQNAFHNVLSAETLDQSRLGCQSEMILDFPLQ